MATPVHVPGTQDQRTQIHLLASAINDGGHALRHTDSAIAVLAKLAALTGHVPGARELLDAMDHDLTHCRNHIAGERPGDGVLGHARKLKANLVASSPAIAEESDELDSVTRSAAEADAYLRGAAEFRERWHADLLYSD